ncbi:unnamed protein product, partial [Meganyctiphanes norvegica]
APEGVSSVGRLVVGAGNAAALECSADGNPEPTISWTRKMVQSSSEDYGPGEPLATGTGSARLMIQDARPDHAGVYLCHASNSLATAPPLATLLLVNHAPVVVGAGLGEGGSWAPLAGTGRLECRVRAAPTPTIAWTTHDGLTIVDGPKYILHQPEVGLRIARWIIMIKND